MHKMQILISLFIFTFLFFNGCKDESDPVTPPSDHFDPSGWIITDESQQPVIIIWQGTIVSQWNGNAVNDTLFISKGIISDHFEISFLEDDSTKIDPPQDSDHTFGYNLPDTSFVSILPDEAGGWGFHLLGKNEGNASIELQVLHLGHVDIRTPYIPIVVSE